MTKVAQQYFSILNDYFREAYEIAYKNNFVKDNYWHKMLELYDPILANSMMGSLYEDLRRIDWDAQEQHIRNIGGLKTSYSGSVYGYLQDISQTAQFLKKACLYADTIILNDIMLSELWSWEKKGRTGWEISFPIVLSSAIDFIYLKELFFSDIGTPVCSLAPSLAWSLEKENRLTIADDIVHQTETSIGSQVFREQFSSYEELTVFLSKIASPELFFSRAKDMSMLRDPNGNNVSSADFQKYKDYFETKYKRPFDNAEIFGSLLRGNYSMITYDLIYHGKFQSVMSTDFKGVWKSLIWLMQNSNIDSSNLLKEKASTKESAILQALQEENIRWLGNIPLRQIKELREKGELQELRDLLGKNIKTIEEASDEEFFEVGQQVKYNIEQAIKKHSDEVQDLNKKYRKNLKFQIPSLIVSGGLAIAASASPPIAWIASILGGTSVSGIVKDYMEKRSKIKDLKKKPVGMLFDAHQSQRIE